jgi:hypothetical protein
MKKDLLKTYNYVQSLYQKGNTNNEELSELLTMLKEISDARPTEISEDFKSIFSDLDLSDDNLNDSSHMLMMFLTKLAVSYKPTNSSEFPHKLLEMHYGNLLLVQQISSISEASLSKFNVELTNSDITNEKYIELIQNYMSAIDAIRVSFTKNYWDTQQKIEEWLKEIRY